MRKLILLFATFFLMCEEKAPAKGTSKSTTDSESFKDTYIERITPLQNGNAYAYGPFGVWFLVGNKAFKVEEFKSDSGINK